MGDHEPMDARWVEFLPGEDGESCIYSVGKTIGFDGGRVSITRITVQEDLPGMYCNMRRVCVWNVQGVGYLPTKEPAE